LNNALLKGRVQGRFEPEQIIGIIGLLPDAFSESQKAAVVNWLCGTNISENYNNFIQAKSDVEKENFTGAFGKLQKVINNENSKPEERNNARLQFAAISLESGKDFEQGKGYVEAIIEELDSSDPQNAQTLIQAHWILGGIYNKREDIQGAISQFEKAVVLLEKQPESVASENQQMIKSLYRDLGSLYIQEKSFRQAQKYFNKVIEITPEERQSGIIDVYFELAQAQRAVDDLTAAMQTYEKVKELAGNTHDAMSIGIAAGNLGAVYMQQGKQSEALMAYDDAINKFGEILSNLLRTPNVTTKEVQPPKVMLAAVTILKRMIEADKVLEPFDINKIINEDLSKFNIAGQKDEIRKDILGLTFLWDAHRNIGAKISQNINEDGEIPNVKLVPLMQEFAKEINPQTPNKALGLAYWARGLSDVNIEAHVNLFKRYDDMKDVLNKVKAISDITKTFTFENYISFDTLSQEKQDRIFAGFKLNKSDIPMLQIFKLAVETLNRFISSEELKEVGMDFIAESSAIKVISVISGLDVEPRQKYQLLAWLADTNLVASESQTESESPTDLEAPALPEGIDILESSFAPYIYQIYNGKYESHLADDLLKRVEKTGNAKLMEGFDALVKTLDGFYRGDIDSQMTYNILRAIRTNLNENYFKEKGIYFYISLTSAGEITAKAGR
ncbi:MAG: hypothetical protein KJ710_04070, partial [Candidatus Omnitrophica bacterium]|nr:hypothetical protein [Candidatus Omnitrophota bacterium]